MIIKVIHCEIAKNNQERRSLFQLQNSEISKLNTRYDIFVLIGDSAQNHLFWEFLLSSTTVYEACAAQGSSEVGDFSLG